MFVYTDASSSSHFLIHFLFRFFLPCSDESKRNVISPWYNHRWWADLTDLFQSILRVLFWVACLCKIHPNEFCAQTYWAFWTFFSTLPPPILWSVCFLFSLFVNSWWNQDNKSTHVSYTVLIHPLLGRKLTSIPLFLYFTLLYFVWINGLYTWFLSAISIFPHALTSSKGRGGGEDWRKKNIKKSYTLSRKTRTSFYIFDYL